MKPKIDKTKLGSITIDGKRYEHDLIIRLDGKVENARKSFRKKYLAPPIRCH
jgi:hypothetical protein